MECSLCSVLCLVRACRALYGRSAYTTGSGGLCVCVAVETRAARALGRPGDMEMDYSEILF